MFPLKQRKIGGYTFGQLTFYHTKHTGTDYVANYVNYSAPFDGFATSGQGPEGGIFWTLTRPNGDKLTARHLSKVIKTGQVKEGDPVAITGNTGSLTTNPHLHQEVYINGVLSDPEKYNWNTMPTYPLVIKASLVINGEVRPDLASELQQIKDWYATNSGNKLNIDFISPRYSSFTNIPFLTYPDGSATIDEKWFDANVLDKSADTTILIVKYSDLPGYFPGNYVLVGRTLGYMGEKPTKTVVACDMNDMSQPYPNVKAFVDYVRHELMHTCYLFSGQHIGSEYFGLDYTHKYFFLPSWSPPGLGQPEGAFSELNYININETLKKGNPMITIRFDDNPTKYVLADDLTLIGIASGAALTKTLKGRPEEARVLPASQRSTFTIADSAIN